MTAGLVHCHRGGNSSRPTTRRQKDRVTPKHLQFDLWLTWWLWLTTPLKKPKTLGTCPQNHASHTIKTKNQGTCLQKETLATLRHCCQSSSLSITLNIPKDTSNVLPSGPKSYNLCWHKALISLALQKVWSLFAQTEVYDFLFKNSGKPGRKGCP